MTVTTRGAPPSLIATSYAPVRYYHSTEEFDKDQENGGDTLKPAYPD